MEIYGINGFVIGPLLATFFLSWLGMPGTFIFGLLATVMASILLLLIMRMVAPEAAAAAQRTATAAYGAPQAGTQGKDASGQPGGATPDSATLRELESDPWHLGDNAARPLRALGAVMPSRWLCRRTPWLT